MHILIDYDNVDASDRRRGVEPLVTGVLDAVGVANLANPQRVAARLYGGWFSGARLSRRAQTVTADLAGSFRTPIAMGLGAQAKRVIVGELAASGRVAKVVLKSCDVQCVVREGLGIRVFDPEQKRLLLRQAGFLVEDAEPVAESAQPVQQGGATVLFERVLRQFLKSTQANEDILRRKLGSNANEFFDDVLPELERTGVMQLVAYAGRGHQRRYRLGVAMAEIQEALSSARGQFPAFLARVSDSGAKRRR